MNQKQHTVLCVDDEPNILTALKRLLRKEPYSLLTSASAEEGLKILAENEVHVIISDQRMPGMNGVEFLRQARELYPDIIRIILTGYTEVDSITQAINKGHIYKFFLKPWNDQHLTLEIRQALEQYDLIKENKRLYEKTNRQNEELKIINENLERIVAKRTESLELQNQALQLSHAILENMPIPIIGISDDFFVAFINRAAKEHFSAESHIDLGSHFEDYFTGITDEQLSKALMSNIEVEVTVHGIKSQTPYLLKAIPLSGFFQSRGLVLTSVHP